MQQLISSKFDTLSPQLKRAAAFIAEHPEEVATRSLRQLAASVDISPPTFTRLATALGFENYEALRESCRHLVKEQKLLFAEKASALRESGAGVDSESHFVLQQANAAIVNINQLVNSIDLALIDAAAERFANARKVVLAGMMSSKPFVDYMAYMASMGFENWSVLGGDPGMDASVLAGLTEGDAALVIAKAPYAERAIHTAQQLHQQGVSVIGITDSVSSPLCAYCRSVFFVSTDTPQFFTSHAATLVLIESLIGVIIANSNEQVEQRIAAVEAKNHEVGNYFFKGDR